MIAGGAISAIIGRLTIGKDSGGDDWLVDNIDAGCGCGGGSSPTRLIGVISAEIGLLISGRDISESVGL